MSRHFESPHVWKARGRGFSMGLIQPQGDIVHLTGQVAWDAEENLVGAGDAAEQTRQCFRNIEALLNEVGGSLRDLVSITTYFVDLEDLPKIQAVSTSVRIAGLGHPDFLVELTPIAVIAPGGGC